MLFFLGTILLLLLGCDIYIWFNFLYNLHSVWRWLWWLPLAFYAICMVLTLRDFGGWQVQACTFFFMGVLVPKLVFCLLSLVGKLTGLMWAPTYTWFNILALTLSITIFVCVAYGMIWGWKRVVVKQETIAQPTLPSAFNGYRIVQFSDLHIGTFGNDTALVQRLVDTINAQKPDLIVFTGDLVNVSPAEAMPFRDILARLHAPDGVISILGNHDYCLYRRYDTPDGAERQTKHIIEIERGAGWNLLLDSNTPITRGNDTIYVAGVQNIGKMWGANRGNLASALDGIPDNAYTILLSHDPTHWSTETTQKTDIPLTLSGHTHGMQLKVFGKSPSAWIYKNWGGRYTAGQQTLYVSTGLGSNIPFRFGAWPEIVVITLTR